MGQLSFPESNLMTPEAVAKAMRVLEIHEKLGQTDQASGEEEEEAEQLGDSEVAVLKEMCNVRGSNLLIIIIIIKMIILIILIIN